MESTCKFVFVSNYLNHHQIPFCNAMYETLGGSFSFIQTQVLEQERISMGWKENESRPYLKFFYRDPEECRKLIAEAEVVMFGGTDDESYIEKRLESGKPVIRDSERLYKTGQWKAVSPRGLRKKYHDHTRYRNGAVYLLCAGAYVASDFHIIRAYPGKMYRWGYFPETKLYDMDRLMGGKGWREEPGGKPLPYLLWAARMIDWKHPELALETARYLKEKGQEFHMDLIGDGPLREQAETLRKEYGLENCVRFLGFRKPEEVREYMEKADIFLFTSDRQEGWGAVANEAMNSGCALVADHMIGCAPWLIKNGENGFVYRDGDSGELFALAEKLAGDRKLTRRLGRNACETITKVWNAENAVRRLTELCVNLGLLRQEDIKGRDILQGNREIMGVEKTDSAERGETNGETADGTKRGDSGFRTVLPGEGPCSEAPVVSERKMYRILTGRG